MRDEAKRTEGTEDAEDLDRRDVHVEKREIEQRAGDDEEVELVPALGEVAPPIESEA